MLDMVIYALLTSGCVLIAYAAGIREGRIQERLYGGGS